MNWVIMNGPWKGRSSSHVHGPVTNGPTRVVREEDVRAMLRNYYNRPDDEINRMIRLLRRTNG